MIRQRIPIGCLTRPIRRFDPGHVHNSNHDYNNVHHDDNHNDDNDCPHCQ